MWGRTKTGRRTWTDKRVRFTLRLDRRINELLRAISFNHNISKQKIIEIILSETLDNDRRRSELFEHLNKQRPQSRPYVFIRE